MEATTFDHSNAAVLPTMQISPDSRPRVGIERLATRRTQDQPRGRMNCQSCRRRKIKCNRLQPGCEACQTFGSKCVYDAVPRKRGPKSKATKQRLKKQQNLHIEIPENIKSHSITVLPSSKPRLSTAELRRNQEMASSKEAFLMAPSTGRILSTHNVEGPMLEMYSQRASMSRDGAFAAVPRSAPPTFSTHLQAFPLASPSPPNSAVLDYWENPQDLPLTPSSMAATPLESSKQDSFRYSPSGLAGARCAGAASWSPTETQRGRPQFKTPEHLPDQSSFTRHHHARMATAGTPYNSLGRATLYGNGNGYYNPRLVSTVRHHPMHVDSPVTNCETPMAYKEHHQPQAYQYVMGDFATTPTSPDGQVFVHDSERFVPDYTNVPHQQYCLPNWAWQQQELQRNDFNLGLEVIH